MSVVSLGFPPRNELRIAATLEGRELSLSLAGTADMRVSDDLASLLTRVHAEAIACGATSVTVDMTQLEFMNSSCFKGFVSWVSKLQSLEAGQRYLIVLKSNASLRWQKRSLAALVYFAPESVRVEPVQGC